VSYAPHLVVDDDPHICLAIRAWLKRYGFGISIADGGTNGLAALEQATFDLMIVDIFMPNMRGFESIRATLAAVADAFSAPPRKMQSPNMSGEVRTG